jgi:uncharacterized membrane protein
MPSVAVTPGGARSAGPRSLAAGAGVSWLTEGWRIFTAAPGPWLGITLIFFLIMFALGLVPVAGMAAQQLLAPVFAGGAILGCQALARGEPLTITHLFDGFKAPRMSPLMLLGLINLGISAAIWVAFALLVAGAVGFTGGFASLLSGDPVQLGAAVLASLGFATIFGLLIAIVGVSVLAMMWWFAVPLIVVNGVAPWNAMTTSLHACLRNVLPFLLYGVVLIGLAIVASIPFFLGWLVLAPVAFASQYASWRQVFAS